MKVFKIEFICFSALAFILLIGQVRVNFGWYNYTDIRATLADKDWRGAPYIVKEVNFQNRCFEDGHIFRMPYQWDGEKVLDDYPYFLTSLQIEHNQFYSEGKLLELCMDLEEESIEIDSKNWLSSELSIKYKYHVYWKPLIYSRFNATDDYEIIFTSKLSTVNVGSSEYKEYQIREFALRRALDVIVEYGEVTEDQIEKLYPALLAE